MIVSTVQSDIADLKGSMIGVENRTINAGFQNSAGKKRHKEKELSLNQRFSYAMKCRFCPDFVQVSLTKSIESISQTLKMIQ